MATLRSQIDTALDVQYQEVSAALSGGSGLVIHGNVDRPEKVKMSLPEGFRYVHGEVADLEGLRLGLVGGGISTPMAVPGEVPDNEMTAMLDALGQVDVLCTHVPPAIDVLRRDVITGREERGSEPIRAYLDKHQPRFHFFGDVHQAQATTWRVGSTRCFNAGYFRATGRYLPAQIRDGSRRKAELVVCRMNGANVSDVEGQRDVAIIHKTHTLASA